MDVQLKRLLKNMLARVYLTRASSKFAEASDYSNV
jgi:hypothetical protein